MLGLRETSIAAALAAAALFGGGAATAIAQAPLDGAAYAFPVPDYVGTLVGANTLGPVPGGPGAAPKRPGPKQRPAPRPTARQRATLRFAPVPSVTQSVYARVIAEADPATDPAVLTAQLDAAKSQVREVMARVGWSPHDLADVAAFAFVQGYITWREQPVLPPAGLRALRQVVGDNLARQPQVRRLSDARQQEIAELLELRVILFLDQRNDAVAAGDTALVAVARAEMRDWTKEIFGIDVNRVRLTARGLRAV